MASKQETLAIIGDFELDELEFLVRAMVEDGDRIAELFLRAGDTSSAKAYTGTIGSEGRQMSSLLQAVVKEQERRRNERLVLLNDKLRVLLDSQRRAGSPVEAAIDAFESAGATLLTEMGDGSIAPARTPEGESNGN